MFLAILSSGRLAPRVRTVHPLLSGAAGGTGQATAMATPFAAILADVQKQVDHVETQLHETEYELMRYGAVPLGLV